MLNSRGWFLRLLFDFHEMFLIPLLLCYRLETSSAGLRTSVQSTTGLWHRMVSSWVKEVTAMSPREPSLLPVMSIGSTPFSTTTWSGPCLALALPWRHLVSISLWMACHLECLLQRKNLIKWSICKHCKYCSCKTILGHQLAHERSRSIFSMSKICKMSLLQLLFKGL